MPAWKGIVVHHTASDDHPTVDLHALERWHVDGRGWRAIGYHWIIERVGDVWLALPGRPMTWVGSHAPGRNFLDLGVAFVGDFSTSPPPAPQVVAGAKHIAGLFHLMGVAPADVAHRLTFHRDHKSTACPGAAFPVDELRDRVANLLKLAE